MMSLLRKAWLIMITITAMMSNKLTTMSSKKKKKKIMSMRSMRIRKNARFLMAIQIVCLKSVSSQRRPRSHR